MADLNPQPLPPRAIRVQLPHTILNDLESFQKVQASILAQAGHQGCTSGMQFDWQGYENWVVDLAGNASPVALGALNIGREG